MIGDDGAPAVDPTRTALAIGGETFELTVDDGRRIRDAVVSYCAVDRCEGVDVDRLAASEVFIDPDGVLRVGAWYVDSHFGDGVLVHRHSGGDREVMVMQVAHLERSPAGEWSVVTTDSVPSAMPVQSESWSACARMGGLILAYAPRRK